MDLHIALMQELRLLPGCSHVSWKNSNLVSFCCQRLRNVNDALSLGKIITANDIFFGAVTWRPRFCKDIFILFPKDSGYPTVATISQEKLSLYNAVEVSGQVHGPEDIVVMGHVTADLTDTGFQVVVLVYDVWTAEFMRMSSTIKERYLYLIEHQDRLRSVSIGNAKVSVQWTGEISVYEKVCNLSLPHEVDGVVGINDTGDYYRIQK